MNIKILKWAGLRDLQFIGTRLATFRHHKYVVEEFILMLVLLLLARCNPPGIKIDIVAKRCVICHLKAWTLLIIVA